MGQQTFGYSPNILIYLEVNKNKIQLSDLLHNSALIAESVEVAPQTKASLVISIDGVEKSHEVLLDDGISKESSKVTFSYTDPKQLNGRQFS